MIHPNPSLRRLLAILPAGPGVLAHLLGRNERTIRRWLHGHYPIDPDTAAWIERLCDWVERTRPRSQP